MRSLPRVAILALVLVVAAAARLAGATAELARAGDAFVLQENGQRVWVVGNDAVSFKVGLNGNGALNTLGLDRTGSGRQWKPGTAADFTFLAGGRRLTPGQSTFTFRDARASATDTAVRLELVFEDATSKIRVTRNYACGAGFGRDRSLVGLRNGVERGQGLDQRHRRLAPHDAC